MRLTVQQPTRRAPRGSYPGGTRASSRTHFRATGEYRPPRAGEYFLSGAVIEAYRTSNALVTPYWIAEIDPQPPCPACGHRKART